MTESAGTREVMPRIRMRGITKRYGAVQANDHVDLDVARGGIHAIVGENGAGKTTLMRILYGLTRPDHGTIELDGAAVRISSPAEAMRLGIGMVHQRFELVESLSALENLVLGHAPRRFGYVFDRDRARARAVDLAHRLGATIDWDAPVANLTVGARQRLQIMRLLYEEADILIFDEPTSVLTPQEADELFVVLRRLAVEGRTLIFISHKLREVFALADRVTVMRRGRVVASSSTAATDPRALATQMVGEMVDEPRPTGKRQTGPPVLEVDRLTVANDRGEITLRDASVVVRAGEIVGIAGVEGSGQRELVETVVGLRRPLRGTIRVAGRSADGLGVLDRRRLGLAFISEDRDNEGACLTASLADNVIAIDYDAAPLARLGQLRPGAIARFTHDILERFGVVGGTAVMPARALSGGNVQRLVVGRELRRIPRLLVAAHPARGVDVRGTAFIDAQLDAARASGAAILLVSEELSELIELADRLLVLFGGRIVAELEAGAATPERLGALMTGLSA